MCTHRHTLTSPPRRWVHKRADTLACSSSSVCRGVLDQKALLTKTRIPTSSVPLGRWAATCRPQCLRRARTSSNPTGRRPHPGRPRACLGQGEGGLRGCPEPESPLSSPHLSFPRRSTTSTKWQSAAPRAGSAALRPVGRTRPPRPQPCGASGRSRCTGGPGPPACTALPPPAPVPSPSMRAAASLPVKVSPGPSCRTPPRPGEAEKGGGMRERDLTPSLREDGHLDTA